MAGLAIVSFLMASLPFIADGVSAAPPQERDFFGIVVAVEDNLLQVSTDEGIVDVVTSDDTVIRLPLKRNASLSDLVEGDVVAVSLDDDLVAAKIFVIPGKTQFRHVPGEVISVTDDQITIRPLTEGAELISFNITSQTKLNFREGATELISGVLVIVLTSRDALTGELSPDALEIHVTAVKPRSGAEPPIASETPVPENIASIAGIFQGIDDDRNWLVSGRLVFIDRHTKVDSGIVVGQQVQVEGELMHDGSVYAHEIKALEESYQVRSRTRLDGVFEGVDENGNWLVSGTTVIIGTDTDTDGLPFSGQRVRVEGLVQEDGSFIAREVENKVGTSDSILLTPEISLEGIFEGIDSEGNWLVNGARVAVSKETRLEGAPTVGSRVKVRAVLADNSILALRIEGTEQSDRGSQPESRVEFTGTIESVDDDSLVIDGNTVFIDDSTDIDGELEDGAQVKVEAWLLIDGSLLARQVERMNDEEESPEDSSNRVRIEGAVDAIVSESVIEVNGIKVVISPDLEIGGEFVEGKAIRVEGHFLNDGSILAMRIQGGLSEKTVDEVAREFSGIIEGVLRQNDAVYAIILSGRRVEIVQSTEIDGPLYKGKQAKVRAVRRGDEIVAERIAVNEEGLWDDNDSADQGVAMADDGSDDRPVDRDDDDSDYQPVDMGDDSGGEPDADQEPDSDKDEESGSDEDQDSSPDEDTDFRRQYQGVVAMHSDRLMQLENGKIFTITRNTKIIGALAAGVTVNVDALLSSESDPIAVKIEVVDSEAAGRGGSRERENSGR